MKKKPAKQKRTSGASRVTARKPSAKKPTGRVAPKSATTKKTKSAAPKTPVHGKHIHPYGTPRHADLDWQMNRFNDVVQSLAEGERKMILQALEFARERHGDQRRIGGSPYIIHPVRIANLLVNEWRINAAPVLAAALLHDVVEDTQTTIKEVKDRFGNDIGKLVDGMTRWKGSETHEIYCKRVSRGPEELRMMLCADALDNLRSWYETGDDDRHPRWWRNASEHVMPIARNTSEQASTAIAGILNDTWYLKRAKMM